MCKYGYSLSHLDKAMFHSGKVCICIATFSTEFRIDANSCYLIDNRKIKPGILRSTRAEHDPKIKTITTTKKKRPCWVFDIDRRIGVVQEPISRSFHLPYLLSESTLSRIFLFLEAPPTGFIAGVYKIANYRRAVVLCLHHIQRRNRGQPSPLAVISFRVLYERQRVFAGNQTTPLYPPTPHTYFSSKNKQIRDMVDSRVQFVWKLRVMAPIRRYCLPKRKLRILKFFAEKKKGALNGAFWWSGK